MYDPHERRSKSSSKGRTNLASCIVATVFLLLLAAAAVVVYFILFKPKPPKIAVDSVQFPTFSTANGSVTFTFFQLVTVTNPNRDQFTHYDSSLQLLSSDQPVGLVFIPAGKIDGGQAQHMSAKFDVHSYPLPPPSTAVVQPVIAAEMAPVAGNTMEIETMMKLEGRVRVLKVFTHRVTSGVKCGVVVELTRGSVVGVHC